MTHLTTPNEFLIDQMNSDPMNWKGLEGMKPDDWENMMEKYAKATREQDKISSKIRYFFFSFYTKFSKSGIEISNMWIANTEFPSNEELCQVIEQRNFQKKTIILSIYEFKCKEDFDSFSTK